MKNTNETEQNREPKEQKQDITLSSSTKQHNMAQIQAEEKLKEEPQTITIASSAKPTSSCNNNNAIPMAAAKQGTSCSSGGSGNGNGNGVTFKFNAHAPEFVPKSHTQMPISGYYYPCFHYLGGAAAAASDWFFLGEQEPSAYLSSNPNLSIPNCSSKNVLTDDLRQKIIKQVYLLSAFVFL